MGPCESDCNGGVGAFVSGIHQDQPTTIEPVKNNGSPMSSVCVQLFDRYHSLPNYRQPIKTPYSLRPELSVSRAVCVCVCWLLVGKRAQAEIKHSAKDNFSISCRHLSDT